MNERTVLTLISPACKCYLIAPACVYFLLHSLSCSAGRTQLFLVHATSTCATSSIIAPQHLRCVFSAKLAPPRHCATAPLRHCATFKGENDPTEPYFKIFLGLYFFFFPANVPVPVRLYCTILFLIV